MTLESGGDGSSDMNLKVGADLYSRAMAFIESGDFKNAGSCFTRLEEMARQWDDGRQIVLGIMGQMEAHLHEGNLSHVEEELLRMMMEGEHFRERGQFDDAAWVYGIVERKLRLAGIREDLLICVAGQGITFLESGELERALGCFREAEEISRELGDNASLSRSLGSQEQVLKLLNERHGSKKPRE